MFPNEDNAAAIDGFTWVGPSQLIVSMIASGPTYRANGTLFVYDAVKKTAQAVKDSAGHLLRGAAPSASADGTSVAYVWYGAKSAGVIKEKLLVFDADNLQLSTVATGKAPADIDGDAFSYPQISPDGSLVYTTQTGSDPGFRCTVYRTDGSRAYVSPYLAWPTAGRWLATKASLAFGGGASTATTSDAVNVWLPGASKATAVVTYPNGKGTISSLAWTPQGKQIVCTWYGTSSGPNGDLWIVGADGTNRHLLLHNGSWPACALAPVSFP